MKTKLFAFALLSLILIGLGSCKKDSTPAATNTVTFKAVINGASETPANSSLATGTATFTYNTVTYVLSGSVTYTGIVATAAHIHKAAVGVPGGVIFPLGSSPYSSPMSFTSPALTAAQRADLMAGMYYVNIHSTAFPAGEIRGQLVEQTSGTNSGY